MEESSTPGTYQDLKSHRQGSACSSSVGGKRGLSRAAGALSSKPRACDSGRGGAGTGLDSSDKR